MAGATNLRVHLLGGFDVRLGDRQVPATIWRQRRAAGVVKLLALETGHWLHREQLLDILWPDLDTEDASNNLRGALHHARRGLETAGAPSNTFLRRERDGLLLGPPDHVHVDVDAFMAAVSHAWQSVDPLVAEQAASLYGGVLLPEDPYEDWAEARREGLRASFITVLARLARLHEERGELAQAVAARRRALVADPLDEATHADLMRLHAQMGNSALALAQYARLQTLLERELGASPEPETRELAEAIREGRLKPASPAPLAAVPLLGTPKAAVASPEPGAPTAPTAPRAVTIAPSARVPAAVDNLIGRTRELAELERLLSSARLVTLTGPGGTGKTRLAQEAARGNSQRFPDGVAFVELAPLRDPELVVPTIARAIGVEETGDTPVVNLLAAAIGDKRLLLVLDNLEQVAAAASDLAALLASCPGLSLLTTSRMRLRLRGEHEYPVSPLALPPVTTTGQLTTTIAIEQTPAVELFSHRAREARPGFTLTPENLEAVVAVCRRLDGLPLAIELAAARVRVLTPNQLLRRLEHSLDVLRTTAQDVPARHRTLRDTLSWSHELLTPSEQVLFRRLSVFVGGWTIEAAEAVATIAGDETATLETLARLIDQSLINMLGEADGAESRFTMLETIREFAAELLEASGEFALVKEAHASWYLDLAIAAEPHLPGPSAVSWLDRLESEHDNLRAALDWLRARRDGQRAVTLAAALWRFWWLHGHVAEGREQLETALVMDGEAPAARAAALDGAGVLAETQGDYDRAEALHGESLALSRESGDKTGIARALGNLGVVAFDRDHNDLAATFLEESLALAREIGDHLLVATALNDLGIVAYRRGDLDRAEPLYQESLALRRQAGSGSEIARALNNLGGVAIDRGDFARACQLCSESLSLYREAGDRWGAAGAQVGLALATHLQGDASRAVALLEESLSLFSEVGDQRNTALATLDLADALRDSDDLTRAAVHYRDAITEFAAHDDRRQIGEGLRGLAGLMVRQGEFERAATMLGAASLLTDDNGPGAYETAALEASLNAVRGALGEKAFTAAWDAGRAMSVEAAVGLALSSGGQ
jgi:predicted ATPase/DNA-binding SARP family transcriptional activator